jgi:hypothetical protein
MTKAAKRFLKALPRVPIVFFCERFDMDPQLWSSQDHESIARATLWQINVPHMAAQSTSNELVRFQAWLDQQRANKHTLPAEIELFGNGLSFSVVALRLSQHLPASTRIFWSGCYDMPGRLSA